MSIKIYPSILSCDFCYLKKEILKIEESGAEGIHIDIMDSHFVKNLSIGPKIVEAIRRSTKLFLDVHLMMYNPFDYVERFIKAGADSISFHFEATEDPEYLLKYIKKCSKKAGIAFNPETSKSLVVKFLDKCDFILFMSVVPGFCGQKFKEEVLEKIEFTRDLCNSLNIRKGGIVDEKGSLEPFDIQVDGGINLDTGFKCKKAGANILVSGDFLFKAPNMKKALEDLKK